MAYSTRRTHSMRTVAARSRFVMRALYAATMLRACSSMRALHPQFGTGVLMRITASAANMSATRWSSYASRPPHCTTPPPMASTAARTRAYTTLGLLCLYPFKMRSVSLSVFRASALAAMAAASGAAPHMPMMATSGRVLGRRARCMRAPEASAHGACIYKVARGATLRTMDKRVDALAAALFATIMTGRDDGDVAGRDPAESLDALRGVERAVARLTALALAESKRARAALPRISARDCITHRHPMRFVRDTVVPLDLKNTQNVDIVGKLVAHLLFPGADMEYAHNSPKGAGVGDGGDGALHDSAGRRVAIECKTAVAPALRTAHQAGEGGWRLGIKQSAQADLVYVVVLWRVKELPGPSCTLMKAAARSIGWVLVLDNERSFRAPGVPPWDGNGPTLNPLMWDKRRQKGKSTHRPADNRIEWLPTLAAAWVPGLVESTTRDKPFYAYTDDDYMAYWKAIRGMSAGVVRALNERGGGAATA